MSEERLEILKMVEAGQIGAEEAAMLLAALSETEAEVAADEVSGPALAPVEVPFSATPEGRESRWARFWIYPMMAGGAVLILGALLMTLVYASGAARGWLVCGWPLLLLGLAVVLLTLWSRRATWLHLRITEGGKRKIAFSFPLPLTLAAWAVRVAQPFVPELQKTGVDDLIIALRDSASRKEPFFVDVQDDEDGERVEVYIG